MQHTELEHTIESLIEACERSAQTYLDCSRRCSRSELKSFLELNANGCLDAAQSLATLLDPESAVGAPPMAAAQQARDSTEAGTVSAGPAVAGDELELLELCEQAADEALDAYEDAMALDLPTSARSLVTSQRDGARRTHDQIRALRDRAAADRDTHGPTNEGGRDGRTMGR
jgi:uncharacterized protein (TIGR02284 family)